MSERCRGCRILIDPGVDNGQTRACMCEWVQDIIRLVNAKSLTKPVSTHTFLRFPFPHLFDLNDDNFCTSVVGSVVVDMFLFFLHRSANSVDRICLRTGRKPYILMDDVGSSMRRAAVSSTALA